MISISNDLHLDPMTIDHHGQLVKLMNRIYPPAYKHLWKDEDCRWYLNESFSKENLLQELKTPHTDYHFVMYKKECVGIIRVQYHTVLSDFPDMKATFIHRIYLSEAAQGKGIANSLLDWIGNQTRIHNDDLIWLKAMDTQAQALKFYKKQGFKKINSLKLDFNLIHEHLRGMVVMYKML
ncbi:GNAT family N-acetyltransferase [Changchengzhania lutea]|uniref:GNAT family N-acetyltransferase n=1 Tax=Changchengzhania lutea TaxID=2049305 RepID=UPI00115EAE60|nr:GNAT family N-acetyltransferase [Changchengzhania lutea]